VYPEALTPSANANFDELGMRGLGRTEIDPFLAATPRFESWNDDRPRTHRSVESNLPL